MLETKSRVFVYDTVSQEMKYWRKGVKEVFVHRDELVIDVGQLVWLKSTLM